MLSPRFLDLTSGYVLTIANLLPEAHVQEAIVESIRLASQTVRLTPVGEYTLKVVG
jgi:hypothetical protein